MSINPKSVEFHQCHAKLHSICFFFITISKITKEISAKICWQLKTPTRTWKCTRCIMQMSYLYASDFSFQTSWKLAQHAETIRKNVWEKSNDAYSLAIRVQTTMNHIQFLRFYIFITTISKSKTIFFPQRELKKALRDSLTRPAWLGPCYFLLVRSEHVHASYPGLFFRTPGFSPYMGREERRVQGLDYVESCTFWHIRQVVVI